jgi:hypothetical protein
VHNDEPRKTVLKTMSENPAFEWNAKMERSYQLETDAAIISPILQNLKLRLMAAPAIVYRKASMTDFLQEYLVAGISVELNTLTDINLYLSLDQVNFLQDLQLTLLNTTSQKQSAVHKDPAVVEKLQRLHMEYIVPLEVLLTCNSLKFCLYDSKSSLEHELQPLIGGVLNQPHVFCSLSSSRQKLSLSVYTMSLRCGTQDKVHLKHLPTLANYSQILLETLPGKADPVSGIRPAFCTLALLGFMTQNLAVEASIDRPVKLVLDAPLLQLLQELLSHAANTSEPNSLENPMESKEKSTANWLKPARLDGKLTVSESVMFLVESGLSGPDTHRYPVSMRTSMSKIDLTLAFTYEEQGMNTEMNLAVSSLHSKLGLGKDIHNLLDPLNIGIRTELLFTPEFDLIKGQVFFSSGKILCHAGPHHVHVLNMIRSEVFSILKPSQFRAGNSELAAISRPEADDDDGEAFYDDLRLGTFSFSEEVDSQRSMVPPPYQAVYGANTLTWSYPKPRTLTKMVILPVPLTAALTRQEPENEAAGLECQLHYWSRIRSCWVLYQPFRLLECSVTHVDLPLVSDRSCEYAETWRLQVFPLDNIRAEICCSLVSAVRVDSFYSRRKLPNLQVVVDMKSLSVVLHNHLTYAGTRLSGAWRGLSLEPTHPREQPFFSCLADAISAELCMWRQPSGGMAATPAAIKSNVRFRGSMYYTDMSYLSQHTLLTPTEIALKLQLENNFVDLFADVGPAEISFGVFAIHVVKQSVKLWEQVERRLVGLSTGEEEKEEELVPLAQLIVINETSQTLVYGQAHTEETLRIGSKQLAMYCWRSQKTRYPVLQGSIYLI